MAAGEGCVLKYSLVLLILHFYNIDVCEGYQTTINSVSLLQKSLLHVNNQIAYKLLLQFSGNNICGMKVKPTSYSAEKGEECFSSKTSDFVSGQLICESENNIGNMVLTIPANSEMLKGEVFFCLRITVKKHTFIFENNTNSTFDHEVIKWVHQGKSVKLNISQIYDLPDSTRGTTNEIFNRNLGFHTKSRTRRNDPSDWRSPGVMDDGIKNAPMVTGMRVESADRDPTLGDDGIVKLLEGSNVVLRLFGTGFTNTTKVTATRSKSSNGKCDYPDMNTYNVVASSLKEHSVLVNFVVPTGIPNGVYYFCLKEDSHDHWYHQGEDIWLSFRTTTKLLPIWASIIIILCCLFFSALFSGLNLGLMSMDQTDLKIVANTGSEEEQRYARAIMPVRKRGNYLLCSILLGNVLVNSSLTIIMDDLTSGLVAVIGSTLAIVVFGEITPQAICSRHGLAVGAHTIYITKLVMLITFPLAFPISLILDYLLGAELGNVYTRERLKELVKLTTEYNYLEKEEVNIISGALEMRKKVVSEIMTKLEDVYMLDIDNTILDFETISEIMKQGYSRIPVYEERRSNIVTVLYIKDLAFVDPDDNTPLKTLCKFYRNPCNFVFEDMTLDVMFRQFKEGIKGHMAFVHRVNSEGEGDPFYETIGLVTLEDVIEELIQAEIVDETDVFVDNRSKRRRDKLVNHQDFTVFAERQENQRIHISPQLTLATFQYLSTSIDAFRPEIISETILRRMLKQDIIYHIKMKNRDKKNDPNTIIFSQGKAVDYFVLILEGRVEVIVGKENMMFESGPFTYFGTQALTPNVGIAESPTSQVSQPLGSLQSVNLDSMLRYTFVPDYTVRAITEVFYIRIKRSLYLAAKRATLMERAKKSSTQTDEQFDDEVEKLLHSYNDDDKSQDFESPPTLASEEHDSVNNLLELEKDKLQDCIAAAEHGMIVVPNNIPVVRSLPSSGILTPINAGSPSVSPTVPIVVPSSNSEPNGRVALSPSRVAVTDRTKQSNFSDEHIALLPHGSNKV